MSLSYLKSQFPLRRKMREASIDLILFCQRHPWVLDIKGILFFRYTLMVLKSQMYTHLWPSCLSSMCLYKYVNPSSLRTILSISHDCSRSKENRMKTQIKNLGNLLVDSELRLLPHSHLIKKGLFLNNTDSFSNFSSSDRWKPFLYFLFISQYFLNNFA